MSKNMIGEEIKLTVKVFDPGPVIVGPSGAPSGEAVAAKYPSRKLLIRVPDGVLGLLFDLDPTTNVLTIAPRAMFTPVVTVDDSTEGVVQ